METLAAKLTAAGVLGILTLVSGLLLSKAGRPLNPILFNLHKIIAVVTVVLLIIVITQLYKTNDTKSAIGLVMIFLTGILFLSLGASGGMLSFEREWPAIVLKSHQVLPLLATVSSVFSIYLLIRIRT